MSHCKDTRDCRCYADSLGNRDPKKNQICGTKDMGIIITCDENCCPGGCPNSTNNIKPREPYGFGVSYTVYTIVRFILFLLGLLVITTYLKI